MQPLHPRLCYACRHLRLLGGGAMGFERAGAITLPFIGDGFLPRGAMRECQNVQVLSLHLQLTFV